MIKNYKKISLAFVSLLLLESCKNKPTDKIKVVWWNNYSDPTLENISLSDAKNNSKYKLYFYAKDIIDDFENKHPNVEIETKYFHSYSDISKQIIEDSSTGALPAMALAYPDTAKEFLNSGIPINNVYSFENDKNIGFGKRATEKATFEENDDENSYVSDISTSYDGFVKNYIDVENGMYENNTMYSLPYSKSGEVLFYNSSVFDKTGAGKAGSDAFLPSAYGENAKYIAPVSKESKTSYTLNADNYSFEELIAIARKMQKDYPELYPVDASNKPTYIDTSSGKRVFNAVPLFYDSIENLFITALNQMNIPYINQNGKDAASKILFNNDDAKKVATKIKEYSEEGLICSRSQLPTDSQGNNIYGTVYYGEGKTQMIILSTANVQYFALDGFISKAGNYPHYYKSTFDVVNSSNENYKVLSQGPSLVFFQNKDKRVERASFEFYKSLTEATNSAKLYKATDYFPIKTASYDDEIIKADKESKDKVITVSSSISDKKSQLAGKVLEYNDVNASNNYYFMTQATHYSSKVRSTVKSMLNTILSEEVTASKSIKDIVDTAFTNAYNTIVNSENLE